MEFSYKVSRDQYLRAKRLAVRPSFVSWLRRRVFVSFLLLFCLALLILVSQQHPSPVASAPITQQTAHENFWATTISYVMFFAVLGVSGYSLLGKGWLRDRRLYRDDPLMQGEITANITSDSISTRNSAGATSETRWNAFERWIERKDMVVVVMRSEANIILNIAALSEIQRSELRGILSTALPKK
jgi:hypothetical protein